MDIDFYTEVDTALEKIAYCSSKCTYYMFCPVCDRSGTELAKCSLRMLPEDKRRRFVNLYLRGREGLKAEALENLFNYAMKLNLHGAGTDKEDVQKYLDMIMKVDRTFKVDKSIKEIPLIEQQQIPATIDVKVTRRAKSSDPVENVVRRVEKEMENDKDSLWNSPIADELIEVMKSQAKDPDDVDKFIKEVESMKKFESDDENSV